MTLYAVQVERRMVDYVYVDAENKAEAEEAAIELADFYDAGEDETDCWCREIKPETLPNWQQVWVEGPEGHYVSVEEYQKNHA